MSRTWSRNCISRILCNINSFHTIDTCQLLILRCLNPRGVGLFILYMHISNIIHSARYNRVLALNSSHMLWKLPAKYYAQHFLLFCFHMPWNKVAKGRKRHSLSVTKCSGNVKHGLTRREDIQWFSAIYLFVNWVRFTLNNVLLYLLRYEEITLCVVQICGLFLVELVKGLWFLPVFLDTAWSKDD